MRIKFCLICVLVSATWIGLLIVRGLGYAVDSALIAMLMGGSVVGLTYALGKRLNEKRAKAWKLVAIPLGFVIVYAVLSSRWLVASGAAIIALGFGFYFFRSRASARVVDAGLPAEASAKAGELEKSMQECC